MQLELAPIFALRQCANYNSRESHEHTNTHIDTYNRFLCPIVNLHFHHPKKACTNNRACPPKP